MIGLRPCGGRGLRVWPQDTQILQDAAFAAPSPSETLNIPPVLLVKPLFPIISHKLVITLWLIIGKSGFTKSSAPHPPTSVVAVLVAAYTSLTFSRLASLSTADRLAPCKKQGHSV